MQPAWLIAISSHCAAAPIAVNPIVIGEHNAHKPWSLVRGKSGSFTFKVMEGDNSLEIGDKNRAVDRSEIIIKESRYDSNNRVEFRFIYDSIHRDDYQNSAKKWLSILQWHVGPSANIANIPPLFSINIEDGKLKICYRVSESIFGAEKAVPFCSFHGAIVDGIGYSLINEVKFSRTKSSSVKVLINKRLIFTYEGRIGFNTNKTPYLKIGIYRSRSRDIDTLSITDLTTN